jgi:hypothetical protein
VKLVKIIIYYLLGIFVFILIALILQYVVNVKYTFPKPHAFKGEYLYNPYRGVDSTQWRKANFHAHTRLYPGMKNRADRSYKRLDSLYKEFGYSIISISDYQRINSYESKNKWYIPVYEHGYQYYKNHHLVLNAKNANWHDYFFHQTLNNKQFIINNLKKDTSVLLTIVHPSLRKAYSINEFKYLNNYNCLEIANSQLLFTSYYDTILSAGHPVFIMADDDLHDLKKINESGHSFNLINTSLVKDSILRALKTGRSVGVKFNLTSYKTNEEKKTALQKLPEIRLIALKNDTLTVTLNQLVKTIKFIGQQGIERKRITNCTTGNYLFSKSDTYIRTEIECNDGSLYFFNPVFRYDGIHLTDYVTKYNIQKTWFWRSSVIIIFLLFFLIMKHKI